MPGESLLTSDKVNPYHKPESLLKLNPRGLVPTLQYDNKPLYESTVICEFLEEAYPNHGPKLLPEDPYERARTRIWTDYCTSRIIPAFHRFLQFQPMSDTQGLEEVRQEFLGHLKEFTKEMDSEGPYFSGKDVGLIDLVVAPWASTYHLRHPVPNHKMLTLSSQSVSGSLTTTRTVSTSPKKARIVQSGHDSTSGSKLLKNVLRCARPRAKKKNTSASIRNMPMIRRRVSWQRLHAKVVVCLEVPVPKEIEHAISIATSRPLRSNCFVA